MKPALSTIELEALKLMRAERSAWSDMESQITETVSFKGKNIIKKARKNYFGVFDNLYDPITKKKKIWLPLTREMVETTVKNIDIDSKDINVRAKKPDSIYTASLIRYLLASYLDKINFGQLLNRVIRKCSTEGVAVLKKFNNQKNLTINLVDNLNFLTDPNCNYLSDSVANYQDHWLTEYELSGYDWKNIEYAVGQTSIARVENITTTSEIPYVKITERWGLFPKYFLTNNIKDKKEYIEGVIIVSNIDNDPVFHLIAENKTGKRPYTEFRTKMYDGRWLGVGIAEDLFDLQAYINEIFNIRLNTARIKQLGLFEIRKGSGITPQKLAQLYSGGGILVSQLGRDIKELQTADIKTSSYKDEEQAYVWSQRMTGNWQMGSGEMLPSRMPATTAAIQQQGMQSGFSLQQEELGFCISQFIEELILPDLLNNLTNNDIVRITGDIQELKVIDDVYVNNLVNESIIKYYEENGYYPSMQEIESEKQRLSLEFAGQGKDRFLKIKKSVFKPQDIIDSVDVFVTGEGFDKAVMARQLNDLLINYSRIAGVNIDKDKIVSELLDIMGLGSERFIKPNLPASQMMPGPGQPNNLNIPPSQAPATPPVQTGIEAIAGERTMERM